MDTGYTTVQISVETRDRLMALGKKGDTYEEIILELLNSMKRRGKVITCIHERGDPEKSD